MGDIIYNNPIINANSISVDNGNFLSIDFSSTLADQIVYLIIRFVSPDGRLTILRERYVISSVNTLVSHTFRLTQGTIIAMSIVPSSTATQATEILARVILYKGSAVRTDNALRVIMSGWTTYFQPLTFPENPFKSIYPSDSSIDTIYQDTFSAGDNLNYSVSNYGSLELQLLYIALQTSSHVANRNLLLLLQIDAIDMYIVPPTTIDQPASTTYKYTFIKNLFTQTNSGNSYQIPLPAVILNQVDKIKTSITNLDASDQILEFETLFRIGNILPN